MHRESPVRPMLVLVTDAAVEHSAKTAFVHDQETSGAF